MPERQFVKYTFLKVDPAWRRLDPDERSRHKREFMAACEDFASERLLRAFSLVGVQPPPRGVDLEERVLDEVPLAGHASQPRPDHLEDASTANLSRVLGYAERLIAEQSAEIEALCEEVAG